MDQSNTYSSKKWKSLVIKATKREESQTSSGSTGHGKETLRQHAHVVLVDFSE